MPEWGSRSGRLSTVRATIAILGVAAAALGPRHTDAAPVSAAPDSARSAHPFEPEHDLAQAARRFVLDLKRLEFDILNEGARGEGGERLRPGRGKKALRRMIRAGQRPVRDREAAQESGHAGPARTMRFGTLEGGPNVRANDRRSDLTEYATQSEVSIAAWGAFRVAAWNDGEYRFDDRIGFATSRDGGQTWIDGGTPPLGGVIVNWSSDPVVAVDERSGIFYLCGLAVASLTTDHQKRLWNAVTVARGFFADTGFTWEMPIAARFVRDTLPDKPWIAVDPATGGLYLSYTTFFRRGEVGTNQIEFQRSEYQNTGWSRPVKVSADLDDGLVQGSRPAAGPDGSVWVVWTAVDTTDHFGGMDFKRICHSTDRGATFQPPTPVTGLFSNLGSGAPGFNRGYEIGFPGIAVDRSDGPFRGRVYVTWQEGLDYFDDFPVGQGAVVDGPDGSTPRFQIGDILRGNVNPGYVDDFVFSGTRGSSVILYLDSLDTNLGIELRVLCSDRLTRLAYSSPSFRGRGRAIVFTPAETGDYFVRLAPNVNRRGGYRLRTGYVPRGGERARDQRDVFTAHSDDGIHWSEPRRVNDDPPLYDDWFPEVAVSSAGAVYAIWYDWRDSPAGTCGGWSRVYLARSDDGGESWIPLGAGSDASTAWSEFGNSLIPNQGDYISLFADGSAVVAAWADGRDGDADVYTLSRPLSADPPGLRVGAPPSIESVRPNPAAQAFEVAFASSAAAPASFELLDLQGRRRQTLGIDERGPGRHVARFEIDPGLPPGLYFVTLRQLDHVTAARVAIIR